ncbi:uncharacterized protein N7459_001755 [Penicillium hispanicum]|uniref:uncharacterized protein n=1 Tax=Penicillium hispanicum TaxID=1080232 RepID=UPI002540E915|nr:uncharacterized protein N7459_001755 [Penicillium hispanicum]KAJ5595547.1 hypothetical protein N7459_001755 [Penicillium hispanicum]
MGYSHLKAKGTPVTTAHCRAQVLPIVDRLLEPQTIANFLGFALGQPLPTGTHPSSITRLTNEEVPLIQENFPPGSDGESIMDRVMSRIGSERDNGRLCLVGKNIQSLKSRLWEGIIPMSEQRWQEKQLDHPDNFHFAVQHLSAVVAVFQYLNTPVVQPRLRDTSNLIYDHWAELDIELNRRRAENGQGRISVASLWAMYMTAHFQVMTERAHRWVISHVETLRAPCLQGLRAYQPLINLGMPDTVQWTLTDRLHMLLELSVQADYTIMIPMEGYKGYPGSSERSGPPGLYDKNLDQRGKAYSQRLKSLSHASVINDVLAGTGTGIRRDYTSGESYAHTGMQQIEAQNQARLEARGAPISPLPREPWISACMTEIQFAKKRSDKVKKYSLAIYRLTYGQSDSEWAVFVKELEAHISNWGEGQTGSDAIKPHLALHWLDGKQLNIPEGDIDAAKRHFNDDAIGDENPEHLQENAFLVIDRAVFASYTSTSYSSATPGIHPGDSAGFVLAVDPHFDPEEGISRPDESPGYTGQMRVLGSLVWGDVYALLSSQSARLEDLWPLATDHPNQVYTGPTIPWHLYLWKKQNAMRWVLLREVVEYAKRKMGTPIAMPRSASTSASKPSSSSASPASASASQASRGSVSPRATQGPSPSSASSAEQSTQHPSPSDEPLRTLMLGEFQRYLQHINRPREAAAVDEILRVRPNEMPDMNRLRGRLDELDRQPRERREDGDNSDGEVPFDDYEPSCTVQ